jgi:hypothetical protein
MITKLVLKIPKASSKQRVVLPPENSAMRLLNMLSDRTDGTKDPKGFFIGCAVSPYLYFSSFVACFKRSKCKERALILFIQ